MKTYRSSIEKQNAPYRGVSSREDAVNLHLAALHDLVRLEHLSDARPGGHKKQITENIEAIYAGEGELTASIPTAGKVVRIKEAVPGKGNLSEWTPVNGASVQKTALGWQITTTGLLPVAGLQTTVSVNPGDILLIRFKLTKISGVETHAKLGKGIDSGTAEDSLFLDLDAFSTGQYIEKRLYSESREEIELAFYSAYETSAGIPTSCLVEDFSLHYLQETSVSVKGSDVHIKRELADQEQRLAFAEVRLMTHMEGGVM